MIPLGTTQYIDLRIYNGATAVTGLTLASLTIYFTRNGVACTDSLTLTEKGSGRYQLVYNPSAAGHDYVEVDYAAASYVLQSSDDIIDFASLLTSNNAVSITEDYGGTGALKPTVSNPSSYTLYVYESSDWISGNTDTSQAVDSTTLDVNGNWINTPLMVLHSTYHFVLRNSTGTVIVFKANLAI